MRLGEGLGRPPSGASLEDCGACRMSPESQPAAPPGPVGRWPCGLPSVGGEQGSSRAGRGRRGVLSTRGRVPWPGAHTPSTGGPLCEQRWPGGASGPEGCQLQRGLARLGPRAWAGRTQGPTWCCAACLVLLRMGPVGESSAGAGEPVGFSIRKPPLEKPGGSSGGCRQWGLRGPGGAGGCDKLAEKCALVWGGGEEPCSP